MPEPTQAGLLSAGSSIYALPGVDTGEPLVESWPLMRIEQRWLKSLREEEAFHANHAFLPWMDRDKKNFALDQRAYDEMQRLQDLDVDTRGHAKKAERRARRR